jgi:hypothetical protein
VSQCPSSKPAEVNVHLGGKIMSPDPLDRSLKSTQYPEYPSEEERGSEVTGNLKDRVTEAASKTKRTVNEMTSTASEKLDRQREAAAGGLDRAASTIREKVVSMSGGARTANVAHGIADRMESTASYLRDHDFTDMREDLIAVCRRHPAQAMLSALAVGFLVGRAVRR